MVIKQAVFEFEHKFDNKLYDRFLSEHATEFGKFEFEDVGIANFIGSWQQITRPL